MATLLEILAEELEEWPGNECVAITQDSGATYLWRDNSINLSGGKYWTHKQGEGLCFGKWLIRGLEIADDFKTAIVTRDLWESARQTPFSATALRDRIREIDITVEALEEERLEAVTALADEGLQLLPIAAAVDLQDWRNWQHGDLVKCVEYSCAAELTEGLIYSIIDIGCGPCVLDDTDYYMSACIPDGCFKFHARP
jgi:hypothetical protein